MSDLLERIGLLALGNAEKAEEIASVHGPWTSKGKQAIEDLYFVASLAQELSDTALEDEEAAIMLCLSLAAHIRKHPNTTPMGGGSNGPIFH